MPLTDLADRIRGGLSGKSFDGTMKFDCGEDGVIVLAEGGASTEDRETDCTIRISRDNLVKLLTGQLNPVTGVMLGKLKVSGDMGVAIGLGKLLAR
jgi:putative sterol carrier protein